MDSELKDDLRRAGRYYNTFVKIIHHNRAEWAGLGPCQLAGIVLLTDTKQDGAGSGGEGVWFIITENVKAPYQKDIVPLQPTGENSVISFSLIIDCLHLKDGLKDRFMNPVLRHLPRQIRPVG